MSSECIQLCILEKLWILCSLQKKGSNSITLCSFKLMHGALNKYNTTCIERSVKSWVKGSAGTKGNGSRELKGIWLHRQTLHINHSTTVLEWEGCQSLAVVQTLQVMQRHEFLFCFEILKYTLKKGHNLTKHVMLMKLKPGMCMNFKHCSTPYAYYTHNTRA